ncbi:putative integrase [Sulfurisphaera javensis]|uniref:Integrase n=1 Tax=Sulfurisphaera javensis TaxID=2049879 RepID=A0AAT9GR45_9CREN
MREEKTRYKYGDVIIRERKGRYYVYILENVNGEIKERYVGPLDKVVKSYIELKLGVEGDVPPSMGPLGLEPRTSAASGHKRE